MAAAVVSEKKRLEAPRCPWIEVEHHEAPAHDPRQPAEHGVGLGVGQVMKDARHERLVEACALRQRLERHRLEAMTRRPPAPAREADVVAIEVDAEVLPGNRPAEPAAAA